MNLDISMVVFSGISPIEIAEKPRFLKNMPETPKAGAHYITLKEAAKISGYSPDYLGQLIRGGKLAGKQIYLNVAWVTTEKDLRDYLRKNKTGTAKQGGAKNLQGRMRRWITARGSVEEVVRLARRVIYLVIIVLLVLCVFLVCALVVNIGRGVQLP